MTIRKKIFLFCLLLISVKTSCYAAEVPAGVKLAKNQVLNVGIGTEPPTFDPQKMSETAAFRIGYDLFEGLYTHDDQGRVIPGIADSYKVSPDGLHYTYHIRSNAKFSDGSLITSQDVVFSFRRLEDPKLASDYGYIGYDILNAQAVNEGKLPLSAMGVKALNANTVEITLAKPVVYFPELMACASFGLVSEANVRKYGDSFTLPGHLVSSGAFRLTYWKINDHTSAEKNPFYWNASKTILQQVNYFPIVDENTELQMYQTGQIDFTAWLSAQHFKDFKTTIPLEIQNNPFLGIYYYDLNTLAPPFKDNVKLRMAFNMALDRNIITKYITKRGEVPVYDFVPNRTNNYQVQEPEWSKWPMEKRIAEAQKFYQEAGYSADKPLTITISYNTSLNHKNVALAVFSMWQKTFKNLGLSVQLFNQEWKVYIKTKVLHEFQVARDAWNADYNDATIYLNLLQSNNIQNNPGYKNEKYDALLKQASEEKNRKKRKELLESASRLMQQDSPIIPIYQYVSTHLVKTYVGGYTGKSPLDQQYSREFYIKQSPTTP